ncbi:MAG TPA: TrmH family RNA methyltransferase [Vicinamibacterales bacterium]|nr:TrmH family RNA methyltransferase [Vicinamibacterales bacterium]
MGVSDTLASSVDTVIRIPMLGQKRSLNVATAAGVVLYELVRRRRSKDS